ncbi:MAG: hypothetical protein H6581_21910 [Bacteroidia bacterium]|nr:hypothetical protein [Bacteroidia bacterium]
MKKTILKGLFFGLFLVNLAAFLQAGGGNSNENSSVKVIYAEGKIFYDEIYVTWTTEYERSSCDFIIERSVDGKDWFIRGKMKSKGNDQAHAEYKYVDMRDDHYKYYRIKEFHPQRGTRVLKEFQLENYSIQVDLNEVTIDNTKKLIIQYGIDQDQEILLRIYNRIGEQVVTKLMPFSKAGEYLYQLDIGGLKRGNYLLVVTQTLLDRSVAEKQFSIN